MEYVQFIRKPGKLFAFLFLLPTAFFLANTSALGQPTKPLLQYTVSMPKPANHYFHVELYCSGWRKDTIDFKMPKWMPGYYQIMKYAKAVENFSAMDNKDKTVPVKNINDNTWQILLQKTKLLS